MASDDKKVKTSPAEKNAAPAKSETSAKTEAPATSETSAKTEAPAKSKDTSGGDPAKPEGGETTAGPPSGYSRGEGQKPVSKAYKDNWNMIFAKKTSKTKNKKRKKR
jgi:hypothetical protein